MIIKQITQDISLPQGNSDTLPVSFRLKDGGTKVPLTDGDKIIFTMRKNKYEEDIIMRKENTLMISSI